MELIKPVKILEFSSNLLIEILNLRQKVFMILWFLYKRF